MLSGRLSQPYQESFGKLQAQQRDHCEAAAPVKQKRVPVYSLRRGGQRIRPLRLEFTVKSRSLPKNPAAEGEFLAHRAVGYEPALVFV